MGLKAEAKLENKEKQPPWDLDTTEPLKAWEMSNGSLSTVQDMAGSRQVRTPNLFFQRKNKLV